MSAGFGDRDPSKFDASTSSIPAPRGDGSDSHDDLTPSQRRAVEHLEGPLLVLAGPGSGKTRVITRRIAQLVERGISPASILAITFTNKAAGEMAERVARILPGTRVWISTFHRFCARILRQRAEVVGLKPNFTILDADDQRRLIRAVVRQLNYDAVNFPPERIAERISRAKNDLITADAYERIRSERVGDLLETVVARVYPEYQRRLIESNAVDFDDLLLDVVEILQESSEIRSELDDRFRYILVDEYQDTNHAQYQIVAALSRDFPNLCVTGDPDQSIYSWRGARIDNILRFEADYPRAAVVRLEENFRSTKSILRAADRLIAQNVRRKLKTMRTDNPEGAAVSVLVFEDAAAESFGIAQALRAAHDAGEIRWSDAALFYRVNALSRQLEQALGRLRIPYQVAAGYAFFERADVKNVLAYLRLIVNPRDRAAFLRVVNVPARGVGAKSLKQLLAWADARHVPLLDAAARAAECPGMPHKGAKALTAFAALIEELRSQSIKSVREFLEFVLERTGYLGEIGGGTEHDDERRANLSELVNGAAQYDAAAGGTPTLEGFLETTVLVSDVDGVNGEVDRVTLMTLHAAKGLEFPVVYIVGAEQGLLPFERAVRSDDPNEIEEERRLLFVGMTRACKRLTLTRAQFRAVRGRSLATIRSEFLRDTGLDEDYQFAPATMWAPADATGEDQRPIEAAGADAADSQLDEFVDDGPIERPAAAPINEQVRAERPRLMTGAELLARSTSGEPEIPLGFAVGSLVRHPQYGVGRVVKVGGFARNRMITVEFDDDARRETFVAGKNPLQPVGSR